MKNTATKDSNKQINISGRGWAIIDGEYVEFQHSGRGNRK